jgi:flagella basal body P-ring formation protein FlgA
MNYILLLAFILFSSVFACEVNMPSHILVLSEQISETETFSFSNCPEKSISDFKQIIFSLDGKIPAFQLKVLMEQRGHSIEILPSMIQVQQMKHLIRDQVAFPSGIHLRSIRPLNTSNPIVLDPGDKVEVHCPACLFGSSQTMNATINGFNGKKSQINLAVDFKKLIKAYRLIVSLPAFSELDNHSILKEEYIESIPHTELVTDLNILKYYKTNKPIRSGDLLKRSDLNPQPLVKAGIRTELILENDAVRIKTQGISRSNGTLGEMVEVFQPQKNIKYQGKVIDINKVLVEL